MKKKVCLILVSIIICLSVSYCFVACDNNTNEESYVISYYINGSKESTAYVSSGDSIKSGYVTLKDNYNLVGWYLNKDYSSKVTFPFSPSEDTSLYAYWEISDEVGAVQDAFVNCYNGLNPSGEYESTLYEDRITKSSDKYTYAITIEYDEYIYMNIHFNHT